MVAALPCRWTVATATATTAALVVVTVVAAAAAAEAVSKDAPATATPSPSPAAATPSASPAAATPSPGPPGENPPLDAYAPVYGGAYQPTAHGGDGYGGYAATADTYVDTYGGGGGGGVARGTPCDYNTACEAGTTCAAPPGGGGGDYRSGPRCRSPAPPCGRCDGDGVTCLAGMACTAAAAGSSGSVCLPVDDAERRPALCGAASIKPLPRGRANGRTPEREAELREKYGRPNQYRWAYYWAMWDAYNRTSKD